jgi:hypothetical protein
VRLEHVLKLQGVVLLLVAVVLLVAARLWSVAFRLCSVAVCLVAHLLDRDHRLALHSKGKKSCKYLITWDRLTTS